MEIDWSNLTSAATQHRDWAGLQWSRWYDLSIISTVTRPLLPGVYRLRHSEYDGLIYIGETGQKQGLRGRRLPALADNVYTNKAAESLNHEATGVPHTAAPSLVKLAARVDDNRYEVSFATPPEAEESKWMRRGVESALIAYHRLCVGRSPWAFESRPENDVWEQHAPSLSWKQWQNPISAEWMGLDWTPQRKLESLTRDNVPTVGVYRTWSPDSNSDLLYIGEGDIFSRLSSHTSVDGGNALYSAASLPRVAVAGDEKHRRDIEAELIGAHVFGRGKPPLRQFNHAPGGSQSENKQTRLF